MADVTVFESGTSPDFVRVILNTARSYSRLHQFDVQAVDTCREVQTIEGFNFKAFEDRCWRAGLKIQDARSW